MLNPNDSVSDSVANKVQCIFIDLKLLFTDTVKMKKSARFWFYVIRAIRGRGGRGVVRRRRPRAHGAAAQVSRGLRLALGAAAGAGVD